MKDEKAALCHIEKENKKKANTGRRTEVKSKWQKAAKVLLTCLPKNVYHI